MPQPYKRSRLWVDPALQRGLLSRIAAYFMIYTVTLLHVGFAFEVFTTIVWNGADVRVGELYLDYFARQQSVLVAMLVILPVLLYDLVKFSHRVAGPLYRCRRVMLEMAQGHPVPEFVPRHGDLLTGFFHAFNQLINAWNDRVGTGMQEVTTVDIHAALHGEATAHPQEDPSDEVQSASAPSD